MLHYSLLAIAATDKADEHEEILQLRGKLARLVLLQLDLILFVVPVPIEL